jgi:hypothetical protein
MRRALVLLGLCAAGLPAFGQAAPQARISFHFENPSLSPAAYDLSINEDGSGHYHSDPGDIAPVDAHGGRPQAFDQDIHISSGVRQQLFALARSHHFFAIACEAPKSKVAFNGRKTVGYTGADGAGSCTYNYSRDAQLNKLADTIYAISNTLEIGRKLRLDLLYDHLSLDADLETLSGYVKEGRALEVRNIAPELDTIDQDPGVMSRARSRAHALLQNAPPD